MPDTPQAGGSLFRAPSFGALSTMQLDGKFKAGTPAGNLTMPPTPARNAIQNTNPKARLTRQDTLLDTKVC